MQRSVANRGRADGALVTVLEVVLPYVLFGLSISGLASRSELGFVRLASGFGSIYTLGLLVVNALRTEDRAGIGPRDILPLAWVSGMAVSALIGAVSFLIWPTRALFWARVMLALTGTLLCVVAAVKALSSGNTVRDDGASLLESGWRRIASPGLVWVLLVLGLVTVLGIPREGAESYTELYLDNVSAGPCSMARESGPEECLELLIGVANRETEAKSLTAEVRGPAEGDPTSFTLGQLEADERREFAVSIPSDQCPDQRKVTVTLYEEGKADVYRSLQLSCSYLQTDYLHNGRTTP